MAIATAAVPLSSEHFPPGHALWLYAVGELTAPSLLAAGISVLLAFALGLAAAWRALAVLLGEGAARIGALLCLAAPSLLDFACTSMDAVFLLWASLAWWAVLRALRPGARARHALLAGVLLLVATCFSFAALPLGLAVLLHALWSGRAEPRATALRLAWVGMSYAGCAVALWTGTGFALWDCLHEARAGGLALMAEIVRGTPATHWARFSYGNLAAFALGSGVALVAAAALRVARGGLAADRWAPPEGWCRFTVLCYRPSVSPHKLPLASCQRNRGLRFSCLAIRWSGLSGLDEFAVRRSLPRRPSDRRGGEGWPGRAGNAGKRRWLIAGGKNLYVVQNFANQIGVVRLDPGFTSGKVGTPITSPYFRVPTTIARLGKWLFAVNARFDVPPEPTTEYEVVRVPAK